MPAIDPTHLKNQTQILVQLINSPQSFVRELYALFEYYSDRTYRSGYSGEPPPLIQTYKIKPIILNQILIDLKPHAEKSPQEVLTLCDVLWEQPYLEFRILSANLIGAIPPDPPDLITSRIQKWVEKNTEEQLNQLIVSQGLYRIRHEIPAIYYKMLEDWFYSESLFYKNLGLLALQSAMTEGHIDNIPTIFRLILPLIRVPHSTLIVDLVNTIKSLIQRSPSETAVFIKQTLEFTVGPETLKIYRQVLPEFPQEIQKSVQRELRKARQNLE